MGRSIISWLRLRTFPRANDAEEELADSEARFRATFENAAVGISHVAPDGRF